MYSGIFRVGKRSPDTAHQSISEYPPQKCLAASAGRTGTFHLKREQNEHALVVPSQLLLSFLQTWRSPYCAADDNCSQKILSRQLSICNRAVSSLEFGISSGIRVKSNIAYGYRIEGGKAIICKEEAEKLQQLFKTTLPGCLCQKQHPAQESKPRILTGAGNTKWYDSTINKILRNEKYMGDALLQKTVTTDFLTKKRVKNTKRLFLDKLEFT